MKIKEHPLAKYSLIKDFESSCITTFGKLTEYQKEYEIVKTFYKTIRGEKNRVYVIASHAAMEEWKLKPMRYRFSAMVGFYKQGL